MAREKAPLGIRLVAGLMIIASVRGIPDALGIMASSGDLGGTAGLLLLGIGGAVLVILIARIVVSYGLIKVSPWAWKWSLIVFGVGTVIQALTLLVGNVLALFEVPFNLVIMGYIWSKKDVYR